MSDCVRVWVCESVGMCVSVSVSVHISVCVCVGEKMRERERMLLRGSAAMLV